jgi:hypothetical protein
MDSGKELLPTGEEFDAFDGYLDAICAWENFGGLSLSDAHVKFCGRPDIYRVWQ